MYVDSNADCIVCNNTVVNLSLEHWHELLSIAFQSLQAKCIGSMGPVSGHCALWGPPLGPPQNQQTFS